MVAVSFTQTLVLSTEIVAEASAKKAFDKKFRLFCELSSKPLKSIATKKILLLLKLVGGVFLSIILFIWAFCIKKGFTL